MEQGAAIGRVVLFWLHFYDLLSNLPSLIVVNFEWDSQVLQIFLIICLSVSFFALSNITKLWGQDLSITIGSRSAKNYKAIFSIGEYFLKMGHSRPLFLFFHLFCLDLLLVDKICRCWDSNRVSLVSEVTTLPTEPLHCPIGECFSRKLVHWQSPNLNSSLDTRLDYTRLFWHC